MSRPTKPDLAPPATTTLRWCPADGAALYAGQAREALARAEQARAEQPPPIEPATGDWPAGIRRQETP